MQKKHRKTIEDNKNVSDDKFIANLNIRQEYKNVILTLRKVIAMQCGIPKEKIHVNTDTKLLYEQGGLVGLDDIAIIIDLESKLSVEISERIQDKFPRLVKSWRFFCLGNSVNWNGFGEYALAVAKYLKTNVELDDSCNQLYATLQADT
jgi:acyl carrier protein